MSSPAAYLDWNATAPVLAEVQDAMTAALARCGNPSSVHRSGRAARQAVEAARAEVAALAGAAPEDVIFTSGGSEANHLALRGLDGEKFVSAIEHDSVLAAAPEARRIPVGSDGCVDLAALEAMLENRPCVSLMHANNETGVIQPVAAAARLAHAHGGLLHCDAVQTAGKLVLDRRALGADLMTLSAHKIGGPQGVGALIASPDLPLKPLIAGGGQERGRRAGTENVPGIVGFGVAAKLARGRVAEAARIAALRDAAERQMLAAVPGRVFGAGAMRLPNTLCIAMSGVAASTQVMALDLAGVMVSAGSACSSGKVRRSHVLSAMGAGDDAECAIRVSLGWSTTQADIDRLVEAWAALYARSRANAA
jgi:cysteine desulfurase